MTTTSLRNVRSEVEARREFKVNKVYGRWVNGNLLYVVYSYGEHFPIYVYSPSLCKWLGNKDSHSATTSRHQSACRPSADIEWMDTEALKRYISSVVSEG